MTDEPALRRVTGAASKGEAEMIATVLRNEGIPSVIRRPLGADVPDFLHAGPREILVRADDHAAARELVESFFGLH